MPDDTAIEFSGVSFAFNPGRPLFCGLSLKLARGAFYIVRGASGSGKSTLLRLINRLEEPSEGTVFFNGLPLSEYRPPELRRSILSIQQTPVVIEGTVRENLLLPFSFKHNRKLEKPGDKTLHAQLEEMLLGGVNLEDSARNLSVGQMQRLCFIRGLLLSPEMLLLDEPASALDEESARIVEAKAENLRNASGLTVVMVSHRRFDAAKIVPLILRPVGGCVEVSI
jgi:putative ABC transport system ATP-binding protein